MTKPSFQPELFVVDVDGVMTDGSFVYSKQGKIHKTFGADDSDGLELISGFVPVRLVSADKRGFAISHKRIVADMGLQLDLISSRERAAWIATVADPARTIYMGDGFYDWRIFKRVGYGIAPANALDITKQRADFVTTRGGGDRAVAEACLHILDVFFNALDRLFEERAEPRMETADA